ncbi:unnamed protein product [Macrosiphum euphorbiae]|uniref:Reverse transcriptase domain-containing protein n=1 Tax=Macrosiphum euphorbiae TaxID=13131 RepID=A0AAV0W2Z4_9HEMI|nr:unnamed protein product [Macrosiphum euphorbiae]
MDSVEEILNPRKTDQNDRNIMQFKHIFLSPIPRGTISIVLGSIWSKPFDAISPILFNLALEKVFRDISVTHEMVLNSKNMVTII